MSTFWFRGTDVLTFGFSGPDRGGHEARERVGEKPSNAHLIYPVWWAVARFRSKADEFVPHAQHVNLGIV